MEFRTIEEAKLVRIPDLPPSYVDDFNALAKNLQIGNESATSKLRRIYALSDKLTAFIAPYMVCEKSCNHCCKIDVLVSSVEAQYIQKNLAIVPDSGNSLSSGHSEAKRPCPFLDNMGTCSIYDHRPFACRTYHAVDNPAFCEDTETFHITYTSKSNGMLNKLTHMVGHVNGNRPIRDIRDFFPNGKG